MIKKVSIILTVLLLIGLMTLSVSAEEKTVIKGDTVYSDAGEQVTLALNITENAGFCTLLLTISYDDEALTLVSVENKVTGMTYTTTDRESFKSGNKYLWDSLNVFSSTGELLVLTFEISDIAESGIYNISVELIDSYKLVGNMIEVASVTVSDAKIYVGIDETETTETTEITDTTESTEKNTSEITTEDENESVTEAQTSTGGSGTEGSGSVGGYTPPGVDTDEVPDEPSSEYTEEETENLTETMTEIATESETLVVDDTEIASETDSTVSKTDEDTEVVTEMPTEVTSEVEAATETYIETENQEVDSATDVATNETDSYINSEEESEAANESAIEIDSETENVTIAGGCGSFVSGLSVLLLAMPAVLFLSYRKDKKQ